MPLDYFLQNHYMLWSIFADLLDNVAQDVVFLILEKIKSTLFGDKIL
jgi:hypothetical protein